MSYQTYQTLLCSAIMLLRRLALAALALCAAGASTAAAADPAAPPTYRLLLWTEQCFDTWFVDRDVLDVPCLKSIVSRGLSFGIIAGAGVLKVPQIYNFAKHRSTAGVAATMLYLDVLSFTPGPVYNTLQQRPFFTYGEQLIVLAQNVVLVAMMWAFAEKGAQGSASLAQRLLLTVAWGGFAAALFNAPQAYWHYMPIAAAVFAASGRVPQVLQNFSQGHTGTLSVFTFFLQFVGGAARVFTNLHETGDLSMVAGQVIGMSLSALVLFQIVLYWGPTQKYLAAMGADSKKKKKKGVHGE